MIGCGKSTLIKNIMDRCGYHHVIHYQKPLVLSAYEEFISTIDPRLQYQIDSFFDGILLLNTNIPVIFDRFTLGECVYAHRYRGYDGSYVFEMEKQLRTPENTLLVLLTTSDWSFIQDDGESFDFSKKEEEQADFIKAFNRSSLPNKIIIDISKDGTYKNSKEILNEIFAR